MPPHAATRQGYTGRPIWLRRLGLHALNQALTLACGVAMFLPTVPPATATTIAAVAAVRPIALSDTKMRIAGVIGIVQHWFRVLFSPVMQHGRV